MRIRKKMAQFLKNGGLFLLLLGVTIFVFLKNMGLSQLVEVLLQVKFSYILIALLAMGLFLFCEGANIGRALRLLGYNLTARGAIKYAAVGFFFSSITPSASGGQPMQVYYMHRDGIEPSHATLALIFELLSFEIVTVFLAIAGYLYQYEVIKDSLGSSRFLLLTGILINMLVAILLLLAIFTKKIIGIFAGFAVKAVEVFSQKKAEVLRHALEGQIEEFGKSSAIIRKNINVFVKTLGTTAVQLMAMYAVPFLVYKSFGLEEFHLLQVMALQAVLYVSVSALPLPGALGISESGFMILFKTLFPSGILSGAMVLSRGISFYLIVFITGIYIAGFSLMKKKEQIYGIYNINCGGR